jgi:hypothetical protein
VVVRTGLDSALKGALRESLLRTEADPITRLELEAFGLKRFVAVDEEDYDAGRLPQPLSGRRGRVPDSFIHARNVRKGCSPKNIFSLLHKPTEPPA